MEDLIRRIEDLKRLQRTLAHPYQRDLGVFVDRCVYLLSEMSKESVNCRRHITTKYQELEQKLAEQVDLTEQYAIMARLML